MNIFRTEHVPDTHQRHLPCCPVPDRLPAFPDAVRIRPRRGHARWRDRDGSLLEWESRDGALDMYSTHGWHLGEFDHVHGSTMRVAEPGRRIQP